MSNKSYSFDLTNPELLKDLGLINQFHGIDICAFREGKAKGDAILVEPNSALGQRTYNYYLHLGGFQLCIEIDPVVYQDYELATETNGDVKPTTDRTLEQAHERISNFYNLVSNNLSGKPVSPSLQALQGKTAQGEKGVTNTEANKVEVTKILHANELLHADLDANPVELVEAEFLYQPVKSTNGGAPYHLIISSTDGVKVAAKYVDGLLSFRVVCSWYNADSNEILETLVKDFAFEKRGGGHYSMTVKVVDPKDAQRLIYAMLSEFSPIRLSLGLPDVHEFKR
ncbi:hypothetical protein [Vibrio phage vB_VhaS-a]|nr:hypothetical protein [Vibrio phage vB_VhaS-a]